ncbi:hypothetical protein Pisl_1275 [Pyrobaculum islandicum DSM 4184]|uniref:Uncharacterized protein n=1 Tax=Pyrobaculum islandicum (strain DSM 4184 / JCM 9189 / GEO3) TaxID=384616 RepID=A1RU07_PYRIL|nr:hypothetical protein [Pyrobaculum islandicum]ABL88439.1 hypothetical protein Pisl_1275 [Pyrobaculum islandicum DSM 4184]
MSQIQIPPELEKRRLIESAVKELGGALISIEQCFGDVVKIETTEDSGCFALTPDPFAPGYPIPVSCEEYCKQEEEDEEEEELWEEFEEEWEQEDEWEEEWEEEEEW